jgi:hypothetical protein
MKPDYLSQGEAARLFPVLATTSKEGRTTAVVLSCLTSIHEFGQSLLKSVNLRVGKTSSVEAFTEIVFAGDKTASKDRPDGLLIVRTGKREWRALIETKVGSNLLDDDQVDRYRNLAKLHGVDCVITISNQFTSRPENHPLQSVRKSRSKIPVYHWSWMFILTTADLLISNNEIEDPDQLYLLNELKRFLTHESTGIKGFDRMPPEWTELNKLVSASEAIPAKSEAALAELEAWHQETRDLSLILTRKTEALVREKLPRKHLDDPSLRLKEEFASLRETKRLCAALNVPDAASPVENYANLMTRTISVEMFLRAPEDRKSTKARVNWLLRQLKTVNTPDIHIRLMWPGSSEATLYPLEELREDAAISETGKEGLQVLGFHILLSRRIGAKFTQQTNFIALLEQIVPEFYQEVGQNLVAWRKSAPKIKPKRDGSTDVSVDALEEEAEEMALDS